MRTLFLTTIMATTLLANSAQAKMIAGGGCTLTENVTVGVNVNNITVNSIADAKAQFDKRAAEAADVAGELKIGDLQMQNMNYNIYSQGNGSYQMSGSYQYKMPSSDVAFKFASMLEKKGFTPNINSNSYRQGNCN